jgi:2-succinyl-5-enolpyruvyl-6-hydroxy-3-cyclohexene-1-carboxylate synthase
VHLNLRFREPLVPSTEERSAALTFADGAAWFPVKRTPDPAGVEDVASRIAGTERGLIYVGHLEGPTNELTQAVERLSVTSGFPVVVEATSRVRGRVPSAIDAAEAVVRSPFAPDHEPELVLRLGRAPLTRNMLEWLDVRGGDHVVFASRLPWSDPGRSASTVLAGDEPATCEALATSLGVNRTGSWKEEWLDAGRIARKALDEALDRAFFEGTIAREVVAALPEGSVLVASSSLPVRALDAFTPVSAPLDAFASRGASGIDGNTSMALGVAAATGRPTVCLTGDLAFLHDLGAMVTIARHEIPLVTVVIDNAGGGIFEFLPQGTQVERDTFEDLFATSHKMDLMHAAELAGVSFASVHDTAELRRALEWAFTEGKSWVIRAEVRRSASVEAHRASWAAAAAALS